MGRPQGIPNRRFHRWTTEQHEYMTATVPGNSHAEIRRLFNERFGLDLTDSQVKGYIARHKLHTGRTGKFKKGMVPFNKGLKGQCAPGSEKGWFKKGGFSHNRVPVGTERITEDGYLEVKYRDGHGVRNWRTKHSLLWEEANGPVPESHCVIFADGDKENMNPENLMLVDRKDLVRMNQDGLPRVNRETTESGVLIARIHNTIGEARRRAKKGRPMTHRCPIEGCAFATDSQKGVNIHVGWAHKQVTS